MAASHRTRCRYRPPKHTGKSDYALLVQPAGLSGGLVRSPCSALHAGRHGPRWSPPRCSRWCTSVCPDPAAPTRNCCCAHWRSGALMDGGLAASGWLVYAASAPSWPPLWILAIWAAFALTLNHSPGLFADPSAGGGAARRHRRAARVSWRPAPPGGRVRGAGLARHRGACPWPGPSHCPR